MERHDQWECRNDFLYAKSSLIIQYSDSGLIGLILTELISDALKYAFPNGQGAHCGIPERKENEVTLEVIDGGVGLPQGFTLSKSMGLSGLTAYPRAPIFFLVFSPDLA